MSRLRVILDVLRLAVLHPNWTVDADSTLRALGADAAERTAARDAVTEVFGRARVHPHGEAANTAVMLTAAGVGDEPDLRSALRAVKTLAALAGVPLEDSCTVVCKTLATDRFTSDTAYVIQSWGVPIHRMLADVRGEHPAQTVMSIAVGRVTALDLLDALTDPKGTP
ncbi:hypothetical protein [Brachybacterium sp.]|uniref:hypothetical protein n=1 Tax=Brachybacterium sp. TaxID=1891286 RepID=UPI002ED2100F